MNDNLNQLIIEATKFLKIARFILILWLIVHILQITVFGVGFFGWGLTTWGQMKHAQAISPEQ